MCDKLLGKQEFKVGSIFTGVQFPDKSKCLDFRKDCVDCEIRFVCGGRCLPQLLYYPDEKLHFYCDLERIAVNLLKECNTIYRGNAEKRYH